MTSDPYNTTVSPRFRWTEEDEQRWFPTDRIREDIGLPWSGLGTITGNAPDTAYPAHVAEVISAQRDKDDEERRHALRVHDHRESPS